MSQLCDDWLGKVLVDGKVLGVVVLGEDSVTSTIDVEARFAASVKERIEEGEVCRGGGTALGSMPMAR